MKRYFLFLLALMPVFSLVSNVYAAQDNAFYIHSAYSKGKNEYDIVLHDPKSETVQIYINGKKSVKAKVNNKGWATFRRVKLSGESKLTFAISKMFRKDTPIKYVKYIQTSSGKATLSDIGAKHTYDEFYNWLTSERYDAMMAPVGSPYQQIMASCGSRDRSFGSIWVACMQNGYKDYLKPETFVNDNWQGDYSTMMGLINDAGSQKILYGSQSETEQYKKDTQEARKIYERLAVTN